MNPDHAARADRLGPYFELQLAFARRMAELTGAPLSAAVLTCTNLHRRFGLGRLKDAPAAEWRPYAEALDAARDPQAQAELTRAMFLRSPSGPARHDPGRIAFGCFSCDPPAADGVTPIHFLNLDTDEAGGPLSGAKLARRRDEIAAMVGRLRAEHPQARHIRGRSWLYNLDAYRRIFPPDYGASARPYEAPVHLHGNSLWGQALDSWERVKPDIRDAVLAALPHMDAERPWRVFPLQVLETRAPIESFERFYGLGA